MKLFLKYGIITLLILSYSQAYSQNNTQLSLSYRVDVPTGAFKNYISNTAGRGFNAGISHLFNNQLGIRFNIGYNDFYQKYPRAVYDDGQGNLISAVITNSLQEIPLQAMIHYTLMNKNFIRPYVNAGAGFNIIMYNQYLGEFSNQQTKTKPVFNAGAGVYIPVSKYSSTSINIGADYNYALLNVTGIKNVNSISIHAGIDFPIH